MAWITDANNKASIIVTSADQIQKKSEPILLLGKSVFYFSCYIPPSCDINQFTVILEDIVEACRGKNPVVIDGDFKRWATVWESKRITINGRTLLELFSTLNDELLNDGRHSFEAGNKSSAIDVAFVQTTLVVCAKWHIGDFYTKSD